MARILEQINIVSQCKKYGLSPWQCPQFLFLVMGVVIIAAALTSYLIGTKYIIDPLFVALIVIFLTAIMFVISFVIIKSFENLAEASRMKSEFINIVSHQLRSPITNIKWITDFLTSEEVSMSIEKKKEYFEHLRENIGRMVELVDELLLVSKIEQGSFPISKRECDMKEMIEELIVRSQVFAEALDLNVKFYPQENVPKTFFDPVLIKIVVENLIDNAIRYSKKEGEIEIWLSKRGDNLYFEIKDTGVGIPEADQKHIFKKFFRSENSLKQKTWGSGLGLYIAKSIIDKSGGNLWFDSREGQGTTFYFTIPIK